jgi:Fe-S cluster assembly protein SufD
MGNNITTNVNIRGINEKNGKININMNGYDKKGTKSNVLNEYAKIINKGKQSNIIIPNLLVDTNDVVANHGASIGCINKEELFYLESKGLDKESATKLIENGYILSIMDNKIKDAINEQL